MSFTLPRKWRFKGSGNVFLLNRTHHIIYNNACEAYIIKPRDAYFIAKVRSFLHIRPFSSLLRRLSLLMGAVRHARKTGLGNQSGMLRTCYSLVRRSRQRTKHQSLHSSKPNVRRQRGIVPACFVALFHRLQTYFLMKDSVEVLHIIWGAQKATEP